jgi:hypothetical protein
MVVMTEVVLGSTRRGRVHGLVANQRSRIVARSPKILGGGQMGGEGVSERVEGNKAAAAWALNRIRYNFISD